MSDSTPRTLRLPQLSLALAHLAALAYHARQEMGLRNVSRSRARLAACMLLAATGSGGAAETKLDPGDAIRVAWKNWRAANESSDGSATPHALQRLLQAKQDLGVEDLDAFGIALIRAAE